jgi:peptidoglycan endopeptidase LytE
MFTRKFFLFILMAALLFGSFALPGKAAASVASGDCGDFYTVQRGDTLREIANMCGTTLSALLRANPQIKNANLIYTGQVLTLPGALLPGEGNLAIYVVQRGDTLSELAVRFDTTIDRLLKLNPEVEKASLIYEGQRLKVPGIVLPNTGTGQIYTVQAGDTLRKIADKFDTTLAVLLELNPLITNPNRIYVGQQIVVPEPVTTYIIQRGDTLRIIAAKFNTTVERLLELNPNIKDRNLIFAGNVIRVR